MTWNISKDIEGGEEKKTDSSAKSSKEKDYDAEIWDTGLWIQRQ